MKLERFNNAKNQLLIVINEIPEPNRHYTIIALQEFLDSLEKLL